MGELNLGFYLNKIKNIGEMVFVIVSVHPSLLSSFIILDDGLCL